MKDFEKLREELDKNFNNKDICVEMTGNINYDIRIKNINYLLNRLNLIISDSQENQLIISLDEIENIEIMEQLIELEFNYDQNIKIYVI